MEDLGVKSNNSKLFILYSIIFSIILIPDIRVSGLPAFRMEQVIVVVYSLYILVKLALGKKIRVTNSCFPIMYTCFSVFIILSILIGSTKGVQVIPNDYYEIYKIFVYLGIYLIFRSAIENEEDKLKTVNFIIICLLVSVIISVQQYFNLFNLNEKYVPYIATTHAVTLVDNYPSPRVVGMTSNPNVYAVMSAIGAILSWAIFSITKIKKYLMCLLIFSLGVLMTLSRSGFAFMVVGIVIYTFFYLMNYSFRARKFLEIQINIRGIKFVSFAIIFALIFIVVFNYLPEELTWRFVRGLNLETDSSFLARLSNWEEHISYFKKSPLFGLGPAKSIQYEHYVDNEWLLFLRRYGVFGTIYFALVFVVPFVRSKDKFYRAVYFSILVACAVYMIVASIYSSFQLMPLIIILAATVSNNRNQNYIYNVKRCGSHQN